MVGENFCGDHMGYRKDPYKRHKANRQVFKFQFRFKGQKFVASEFIKIALDGSDYDRGALEAAHAEAENGNKALGRLIECLYNGGVLSKEDVYKIAGQP